MTERLRTEIAHHLEQPGLDHVGLSAPGLRLRIDVVAAGQTFYWITFIAEDDADFATASGARAALRSFPWTMPFRPRLERPQATLPVLCRWQRAYVEDTTELCITLLHKHFRVDPDEVTVTGATGGRTTPKSQKVWLGDVTAWFMTR